MFYIINNETGIKHSAPSRYANMRKREWKSKAAATREVNAKGLQDTHTIVAAEDYQPTMVERTNMMSGKTFMEDINTPNYCSPASEAYWSM